jgi:DNA-binding transcriptional regulator GbsR (MarR family)
MAAVEDVREAFVRLWGRLGPFWGIPPAAARVYAFLLSLPEGAEAERIGDELGMSRGAVSMSCRELVDWGIVTAERPAGTRRVLYRPETDLEKVIRAIVRTRKRREWDPIQESVREWRERLEGESSAEAAHLRERLGTVEAVVGMVDSMATGFLEGRVVSRLGLKAIAHAARRRHAKGAR